MKKYFLVIMLIILLTSTLVSKQKRVKVAIFNFKGINVEEYIPSAVIEILSTAFIDSGAFEVIERNQLEKVMEELSLQTSDDFNEDMANDLGNLLGAEIIIIGSVTKLGNRITVNIRGIDAGTGSAKFAKKITTDTLDDLPDMIDDLVDMLVDKEPSDEARSDRRISKKKHSKQSKKRKLNIINKAGIGVLAGGGAVAIGGLAVFLVNEFTIGSDVDYELELATAGNGSYEDYETAYNTYVALFATGMACIGLGSCIMIASIPMIVNKKKNVSFNLEMTNKLSFVWKYKF